MTTIKATCPVCGDVDLRPTAVTLTVAQNAGWATYTFQCSSCQDLIEKTADDEVVALLSSAGVHVDHVPDEVLERHFGAPVTYDDLLDLALWLENHDVIVPHLLPTHSQ